jgi:hypothetical protein
MNDYIEYNEKVASKRTEILFVVFTLLFFLLLLGRILASRLDILASVFLFFFCFFLFYSLNYGTLLICLTSESLKLSFGMFTWVISLNNISECQLDDDLPGLAKYGGGRNTLHAHWQAIPSLVQFSGAFQGCNWVKEKGRVGERYFFFHVPAE